MHSAKHRILVIDDDQTIPQIFDSVLSNTAEPGPGQNSALHTLLYPAASLSPRNLLHGLSFIVDSAVQGSIGASMVRDACARAKPYRIIFVDMRMPPGWDGVQTIKNIRQWDRQVQLVAMATSTDIPIGEVAVQIGSFERLFFLKKPFDGQEIQVLISSLFEKMDLEGCLTQCEDTITELVRDMSAKKERGWTTRADTVLMTVIHSLASLLCADDLLLARVRDGELYFAAGLGRFGNGLPSSPSFRSVQDTLLANKTLETPFCRGEYSVFPVTIAGFKDVIIVGGGRGDVSDDNRLSTPWRRPWPSPILRQSVLLCELCLRVKKLWPPRVGVLE